MKYSELYNFEYLFHKVLGFENKLLLKIDGRIAKANIIHYHEGKPTELYSNLEGMNLSDLGYHLAKSRLNAVSNDFRNRYLINPFSKAPWQEDPFLSLYVLKEFFKKYDSKEFDNEQVLYNVKFDGNSEIYTHYLINENTELDVIGITD